MNKRRNNLRPGGFTLIEALVASVLLGSGVMVVCGITTRCVGQVRLNRQYEQAWDLLDRQLLMIEGIGVGDFLLEGQSEGEILGVEPKMYWRATMMEQQQDKLYIVEMLVWWAGDKKRVHQVSAQTLMDDDGGISGGGMIELASTEDS